MSSQDLFSVHCCWLLSNSPLTEARRAPHSRLPPQPAIPTERKGFIPYGSGQDPRPASRWLRRCSAPIARYWVTCPTPPPPPMELAPPRTPGLRIRGVEWVLAGNQHRIPLQGPRMGMNLNRRAPHLCHFIYLCVPVRLPDNPLGGCLERTRPRLPRPASIPLHPCPLSSQPPGG